MMIKTKLLSKFSGLLVAILMITSFSAHCERPPHDHIFADAVMKGSDPTFAKYLFYSSKPSFKGQVRRKAADGKNFLYDVMYTIDKDRRRWNPNNQKNSGETQLLFMGCSITFGEGLNDEETIPAQVSLLTHHTQTFNYGTSGYSPTHMLSYFRYFDLAKQFAKPENTKAIFLWGDYHFSRVIGSLLHLSWGGDMTPYYEMSPTGLKLLGSASQGLPVSKFFSKLIFGTPILSDYLEKHAIDWPRDSHYSDRDIELALQVLKEAKESYQAKFHNDHFYVAFLPFNDYSISKLQKRLNAMGVHTIILSEAWRNKDSNKLLIPEDGHPSAFGAKLIASELVKQLNLQ